MSLGTLLATPGAEWVFQISQHGPAALIVFFALFAGHLIRLYLTTKHPGQKMPWEVRIAVVLLLFSIPVLSSFVVAKWWKPEYVIIGTISNLRDPEVISTWEPVYLHKQAKASLDFEYQWRYISSDRPDASFEVQLQTDPNSPKVYTYEIPIEPGWINGAKAELFLDRDSLAITFEYDGRELSVQPRVGISSLIRSGDDPKHSSAFSVFAATEESYPVKDLIAALDADDPVIRSKAKQELIKLGSAAIPSLADALRGTTALRSKPFRPWVK